MDSKKITLSLTLLTTIFSLFHLCNTTDILSPAWPISDAGKETLVSSTGDFKLGFFSPKDNPNRYVGIWIDKIPQKTVVWVANRESPITARTGVFGISGDGNLAVSGAGAGNTLLWSTNVSIATNNSTTAKLLDSGNLVLSVTNESGHGERVVWQSFDYPTDTVLPGMKFGLNRGSGLNRVLTSWKSEDDPAPGEFSYRVDTRGGPPQFVLYKRSGQYWRCGPWNGRTLSGVPVVASRLKSMDYDLSSEADLFSYDFVNNPDEVYITFGSRNGSVFSTLVLETLGTVVRQIWQAEKKDWRRFWMAPQDLCDEYARCGTYAICSYTMQCSCLPGFEPESTQDWFLKCVEKRTLSECGKGRGEGFLKMEKVKIPDAKQARIYGNMSLQDCEMECLKSCDCTGYASADIRVGGCGCLAWYGKLTDMRQYSLDGQDFYLRVDAMELANARKNSKGNQGMKRKLLMLCVLVLLGLILLSLCCYYFWIKIKSNLRIKGHRKKQRHEEMLLMNSMSDSANKDSTIGNNHEESRNIELMFFGLDTVVAATHNFSADKMLGQGGFGPVFKGQLSNGQEIAVKRLSKNSGQGINELKNEALLIAKLQHRNLVRLLGCCIENEEKILIYEYMPNKSLDYFIFDENRKSLLDWKKRFEIIAGIARGILYLHQDSRLRIIHRDLKASNILLDGELNPKISDFGTARIFGEDESEANTKRVVGTYGYMSPEYALYGHFSTKSDVFSFGVLLLEIVSGKKSAGFFHTELSSNLIRYVWELWSQDKALEMVDLSMGDPRATHDILRCIQVGLLCVQDSPGDRPTMWAVVVMLSNEATLPPPKEPTFVVQRNYVIPDSTTTATVPSSINEVTVTMVNGR